MRLMTRSRRFRSGYTTSGGGGGSGETVNAELWRFDGGSGSVRAAAALPLKPGAVFPADLTKIVLKISGTEQAIAVSALRGLFPDGSLRAVGLQTIQSLSSTPTAATIEIGGATRVTANDITYQEIAFGDGGTAATTAAMKNKAVFAVMDSQYLCDSWATFVGLQPEASDVADNAATFLQTSTATTHTLGWAYDWLRTNYGTAALGNGGARYATGHGAWCAYVRANTNAKKRTFYEIAFNLLVASCGGDASVSDLVRLGSAVQSYNIVYGPTIDSTTPTATSTTDYALFGEQYCSMFFDWPTGYLLTGWKQPWYWLSHKLSAEFGDGMVYGAFKTKMQEALPRFNGVRRRAPGYLAYVVHATLQAPYGGSAGRDNDTALFSTQLPWTIDAYIDQIYTTANYGSYIDGVVGMDPAGDPDLIGAGKFPGFQQNKATIPVLVFYYENIINDSRIPTIITKTADFLLTQEYYDSGTDYWGAMYLQKTPPIVLGDIGADDWFLTAMNGYTFAAAYALTGTASYKTAALRCLRRAQLLDPPGANGDFSITAKAVGEYYDGFMQAAKFWLDGGTMRSKFGAHPTSIVNPPTYTS